MIVNTIDHRLLAIEELDQLAEGVEEPIGSLANIATLVGNLLEADVCSVYLLEENRKCLVLAATVGLQQHCVGRLRMRLDEGLTGLVAQRLCPVAVEEAASHRRFKYFPDAGEDAYESFLGVPLLDEAE